MKSNKTHYIGTRRFYIAVLGIFACTIVGLYLGDSSVVNSIAMICIGVSGAAAVDSFKQQSKKEEGE